MRGPLRRGTPRSVVSSLVLAPVAVVVTGVLIGLAGCSDPDPQGATPSDAGATRAKGGDIAGFVVQPSERRTSTDDDFWSLQNAFLDGGRSRADDFDLIEQKIAECMHDTGWRYQPLEASRAETLFTVGELRRYRTRYGHGIHSGPRRTVAPEEDPNELYLSSLPASRRQEYTRALWGTLDPLAQDEVELPPEGTPGCIARARRAVRADLPRMNKAVADQVRLSRPDLHPIMVQANEGWRRCMKSRGFDLHDSGAVIDFLLELPENSDGRSARSEIAVSTAEVECYLTEVHPVQRLVERAYLQWVVERIPEYADQAEELLRHSR